MRFEMNLTISGMDSRMLATLYEFLDENEYDYVGHESQYDEFEDTEVSRMNFEEYIKQMSHKELQSFIYWVYQNGWEDHSNGAEDSPGDWSFFGGAILKYDAPKVIEKLDNYYGPEWRDK